LARLSVNLAHSFRREVPGFKDRGTQPVWSKDGEKLFYLDGSQKMTAVDSPDGEQLGADRRAQDFFPNQRAVIDPSRRL
jgi:hypothetical protein